MPTTLSPTGTGVGGAGRALKALHATAAGTVNSTLVKAGNTLLVGGYIRNRAASERYFKLYNKVSAPTVGTDVPALTIGIPAGGAVAIVDLIPNGGLEFSLGLGFGLTTVYADNDATAVTAADCDVNLIYS